MPTFVQILDFIGTFAFAISGIRLASAKRFDWFGAYVVGLATAIGGGTIRDVLLDVTPGWMTDPIYLICTGLALLWVICFGRWLIRLNNTFFIFDTIGLALFTVVGVGKSIALGYPFWVAIIMGSITGAAGGVIRDVFINEIPLIFRKEIYAMACVVGGIAYWLCDVAGLESYACQLIGGLAVFLTRILAVKYHICLPILKGSVGKSIALGYPFWVAIIMGSITGAAGGVIRDVFINEIPLIFRKEIYAMACVVGGIAYWLCDVAGLESYACQLIGGLAVFLTRILAVKYHICLPILKGSEEPEE